jgi:CRISPR/Cas system-associated endonuclease/helicase Cas3
LALLTFFFWSVISYSHMGEKHQEKEVPATKEHQEGMKEHQEEMKEHHGEMEEHHEKMEVLHSSMTKLGGHTDVIFHSIIQSDFSKLAESAQAIKEVAEGLEGTVPHKNLENIDKYNSFISALKKESLAFEGAVNDKEPMKIADNFGKVIGICVECHINFRD